jgi:thiamine pyrophosphokinase
MIAKLVCAGVDAFKEIYAPDENEILVGVDGGALKIIEAGYKPKIAIGDFDSGNLLLIARHAERMIIHPEKKRPRGFGTCHSRNRAPGA